MATGPEKKELYIAVVDDSDFTRKGIIETLEANNFKVVGEANSAEKAVGLIRHSPAPNLFIVDVVMPEKGGMELSELIQGELKDCAIIMMSSLKMEDIIIQAISKGANDYLQKPFSPKTLLQSVKKVKSQLEKN